jgi:nitrogen-specific signal transduction histidine kinase
MNTESINFQSFLDWDNSPFILFNAKGKILYLNNAAEILFGYVSKKELYDLALAYAPQNFGYKTTTLALNYDSFSFYAITIGYENDEQISIRFYNTPRTKSATPIEKDKLVTTNINLLLEANITLFKTKNNNALKLLTDPDIPPFKIDQNRFSKLLRKTLDAFRSSDSIHITLKLLVGEHVIISGKKKPIVQLTVEANGRYNENDEEVHTLAIQSYITSLLKERSITLEIPLIQN